MNSVLRYGLLMILALVFITACTSNQDLERIDQGEALSQIIHLTKLGEKNDTIFSWATPTDVQYIPDDEASKQEYLEMFIDVESIKSSFQFKE